MFMRNGKSYIYISVDNFKILGYNLKMITTVPRIYEYPSQRF